MKKKISVVLSIACLAIVLITGCQKKEESASSTPQTQTQAQAITAFSASLPTALEGKTITPGGKAYVDALNKSADAIITVRSEDGFDINGWAFDKKNKPAPETVFIELAPVKGGEKYYSAAKRSEREDLVKAFNNPELKKAAYVLKADITSVPVGEYQINIIQLADGIPIMAPTGKNINKTN